tara:strand:+ start:8760 stop:9209 length:450 start_codon:yes stop_codon:yes gene_type:complete
MWKNSTKFSQEIFDEICVRIAEGESLRKICKDKNMPNITTVWHWVNNNEALDKQYARAREEQAETLVDEIIDISDEKKDDTYLDEDGKEIINQEVIARSRLRVDARKWVASKLKPKRFGDYTKIQAEVKDTSATSSWLDEVLSEIDNNK